MTKKRVGRPVVEAAPGVRAGLSLRVTAELKTQLEGAAESNGRSLSQEAEFRLERTFANQDLLDDVLTLAYGDRLAKLLMTIGDAIILQVQMEDMLARVSKIEPKTAKQARFSSEVKGYMKAEQLKHRSLKYVLDRLCEYSGKEDLSYAIKEFMTELDPK
jgi:TraY domain